MIGNSIHSTASRPCCRSAAPHFFRWTALIIEHELIEQIEEESAGRPLSWVVDFMLELGAPDPMRALRQMWRADYLSLVDTAGAALPSWRPEEIWRTGVPRADVAVLATELGSSWVHG